jgi:hypothetical protein
MIYFVSEKFIKNSGVITSNVDVKDFTPLVEMASKAYVKPMIGTYFFNDLLTKYNNETLSSDELLLVDKMRYAILWRVCAEAVITLSYQLKNKGIQKQFDDNSQAVELNEITFMRDNYIQYALYFQTELKKYLIEHKDDYPNFMDTLNKDSSVRSLCSCSNGDDWNEGVGFFII